MIKSSSQRTKSSLKTGNQGQTTRLLTSRANFVCFRRILDGYLSNRLQYKIWFQGFENTTVLKFPQYSKYCFHIILSGGTDTAEIHSFFVYFFLSSAGKHPGPKAWTQTFPELYFVQAASNRFSLSLLHRKPTNTFLIYYKLAFP